MQGRYLTATLHSLSLCVLGLYGSELSRDERDEVTARYTRHLEVMWEASCSCRNAGYPEISVEELNQSGGDGSACSGLPSPMDVPTASQAAARASAAEIVRSLRQLAKLSPVQPGHPAGGDSNSIGDPASYAGWEVLQAELLALTPSERPSEGPQKGPSSEGLREGSSSSLSSAPLEAPPPMSAGPALLPDGPAEGPPSSARPVAGPPSAACSWGEALWCFNPACTNLSGPSELALKTHACGGGCGVRYCGPECQAQGWRDGHRLSCGRLRERRAAHDDMRANKAAEGQAPGRGNGHR